MTVEEFAREAGLKIESAAGEAAVREIHGCYICDLLSWAMGRCRKDDVWITVQNHMNVVAVAVLTEAACVLMAEGVEPEPAVVERAEKQGVVILSGTETAYELACRLRERLP